MITLDVLLEEAGEQTLTEGEQLFRMNSLRGYRCYTELVQDGEGASYPEDTMEAEVRDGTDCFHPLVRVDTEMDYISGWKCSCEIFPQLCRHCVAVLLRYMGPAKNSSAGKTWANSTQPADGMSAVRGAASPQDGGKPIAWSAPGGAGSQYVPGQPASGKAAPWSPAGPSAPDGAVPGQPASGKPAPWSPAGPSAPDGAVPGQPVSGKPAPWSPAGPSAPGQAAAWPASRASQTPALQSTSGVRQLLNQYGLRANGAWLVGENIRGKVELMPVLKKSYRNLTVEFRIGLGRQSYVLKNISEFVDNVLSVRRASYGKKLEFCHHREAFTEKSGRLVDFLIGILRQQKRQTPGEYGYLSGTLRPERTLELNVYTTDLFFEAVEGETVTAILDYQEPMDYLVKQEEPRLKLEITGGQGEIQVCVENAAVLYGMKRDYYCKDGCIYMTEKNGQRQMQDFMEYMEKQLNRSCVIANEDLPAFCRDLLPVLKEKLDVSIQGFDEKMYLPEKPALRFYLDMPQQGAVSCKVTATYGEKTYNVLLGARLREQRDMQAELLANYTVRPYFNAYDGRENCLMLMNDEELLYRLLDEGLGKMYGLGEVYLSAAMRSLKLKPSPKISVGVSIDGGLLHMDIHSPDMSMEELVEVLSRYDRRKNYVRMRSGEFLSVREDGLETLAKLKEELNLRMQDLKNGEISVPKYRAMLVEKELRENSEVDVEADRDFRTLIRNMKTVEESDFEIPENLKSVLREYQKTGYRWIRTLKSNGFGGILADDMGLGKTLQVISFLAAEPGAALIVCPASLVYNWKREFEKFAPFLSVETVAGNAKERKELLESFAASPENRILITSYDLLRRDIEEYRPLTFENEILDEAQFIKNHETLSARAVKEVQASFRLALTGTPVENRLSELWSIFDFLMPGFLFSYQRFRTEFETPIVADGDEEIMERLRKMVRPFILRRLKKDVLKELPDKLEETLPAAMEGEQRQLYDAHVQRLQMMLAKQTKEEFDSSRIQILSELTKLRQICCDPALAFEGYHGEAAKTELCMELIRNAIGGGHKVLLFSQFTSMLDRLMMRLNNEGIESYLLTGSVPKSLRMEMVESFQKDEVPVFCISLKAGGTGLNLTAADIVIHFDPWWNAAAQNQATDRAHRIGQKQVVTVYRLVARDTIEEKIVRLQERKAELADQILSGEGMGNGAITREELLELLG